MSVFIKNYNRKDSKIILMTKGADAMIIPCLTKKEENNKLRKSLD